MIHITKHIDAGKNGFVARKLDEHLTTTHKKWPRGQSIRPSDIADCPRRIVCDILGFPTTEVITPQLQRIFDNGNAVHDRYLMNYLQKMGLLAVVHEVTPQGEEILKPFREYPVKHAGLWLKARPDAVILNTEEGLLYVFELKSVKQEVFQTLQQAEWSHIAQVHVYMYLFSIPRAIILYENKNTQEIKEFVIYQDTNVISYLLQKIATIQKYVKEYPETKNLPTCECGTWGHCSKILIP